MGAGLSVDLGEVRVHVEHPGIGVAEEPEAGGPQSLDGAGSVDPLPDRLPGRIAVLQGAGDRAVRHACAGEGARELGDAAGRAVRQPLAGGHPLVVERPCRLEVEDDDRRLRRLHRREHLRRCGVGCRVEEDQLDSCGGERLAGGAGGLRGVDEPRADDVRAELGEPCLEFLPVALEPFAQPLELRPVRGEADREHADAGRRRPAHWPSACAAAAWRRASALRRRARARR